MGKREAKQRLFPLPASPPPPLLPPGRASRAGAGAMPGARPGEGGRAVSLAGDSTIYKLRGSRTKETDRSPHYPPAAPEPPRAPPQRL